jgi:hypothetical protein
LSIIFPQEKENLQFRKEEEERKRKGYHAPKNLALEISKTKIVLSK